ncbi:MAG: type II toxin-antitoxin system HicA family toxin [Anaerolineales bacterium]|nr:type II toxin-antitoxin system HicA family toxin [Anaerolineales bacterium]
MPTLPQLSGRETVQAFESLGWKVARQKGSHIIPAGDIILIKDGHVATLSVPDHKEVAKGTLRSLIRSAGLTVSEFLFVLKK